MTDLKTDSAVSTPSGEQGALRDLIARLEKATGPSRVLDDDIWIALDPKRKRGKVKTGLGDGFYVDGYYDGERSYIDSQAKRYTASIDAALTLLPKTLTTSVHADRAETFPVVCDTRQFSDGYEATVYYDPHPTWNIERQLLAEWHSEHSLALALCIAALKARDGR